jgi:hypothetical protein
LCSCLLCYVANIHGHMCSRWWVVFLLVVLYCQHTCAYVFEVVGCVPSCCVMLPTQMLMRVRGGGLSSFLFCYVANTHAHMCSRWWVVLLPVVLCCQHMRMCVRGGGLCSFLLCYVANKCSCVFEVVGCVPSCCVMLPTHMRICVRGGGLCSFLCYVANTCACVFEVVGCVPSCCVMLPTHKLMRVREVVCVPSCCVMLSTNAHACSRWWAVFLLVVLCCQHTSSCVFEVVGCVPSCCVMLPTQMLMHVRGDGLCTFLLCYVANTNAHACSRWWAVFLFVVLCCQHTCACVFEVVGCVPSCCVVLCCVSCFQMR